MKKILSVFFLMLVVNTGWAQEESKSKMFHFGLKAAPGLNWFKPDNNIEKNDGAKFSFGYGIMTEFNFTDNYCFATGLEINNVRGATRYSYSIAGIAVESSQKYKLQYLTIPLTLKMKTNEIGMLRYFGQFGINNGFRLKAKADVSSTIAGTVTTEENLEVSESVSLFRESLVVGLGAEYNLVGNTSAVFSLTYDNGFTNTYSSKATKLPGYPGKLTNKAIILTVGILF
jgi:hypothetical protein